MVKLLKSGSWALEGTRVVEMIEGEEQSFGAAEDFKLVADGWAEWVKADVAVPVSDDSILDASRKRTK